MLDTICSSTIIVRDLLAPTPRNHGSPLVLKRIHTKVGYSRKLDVSYHTLNTVFNSEFRIANTEE